MIAPTIARIQASPRIVGSSRRWAQPRANARGCASLPDYILLRLSPLYGDVAYRVYTDELHGTGLLHREWAYHKVGKEIGVPRQFVYQVAGDGVVALGSAIRAYAENSPGANLPNADARAAIPIVHSSPNREARAHDIGILAARTGRARGVKGVCKGHGDPECKPSRNQ